MHVGAFAILDFDDPYDPSVVYLESWAAARYLEKPGELAEYRKVYDLIYRKTVPIEEYLHDHPLAQEQPVRHTGAVRRGRPA